MLKRRHLLTALVILSPSVIACGSAPEQDTDLLSEQQGASGVAATVTLTSEWTQGYCVDVTVKNPNAFATTSWTVVLDLHDSRLSGGAWNASTATNGTLMTATPATWNGAIPANGSASFGFCSTKTGSNYKPTIVSVDSRPSAGGTSTSTSTSTASTTSTSNSSTTTSTQPGGALYATSTCIQAPEGASPTLVCPAGQAISGVSFASFGTPSGACGALRPGACDAASSRQLVEQRCLGKGACVIPADVGEFGEPCAGTTKRVAVEVSCANTVTKPPLVSYGFDNDTVGGPIGDSSGNGRAGALRSWAAAAIETDRADAAHSLRLNGGENYVAVPALGSLGEVTIAMWVNAKTLRSAETTLYEAGNLRLYYANSGTDKATRQTRLTLRVTGNQGGSDGAEIVSTGFDRFGEHENATYDDLTGWQRHPYGHMWMHLAITYSASERRVTFYINGRRDSVRTFSLAKAANLSAGRLGAGQVAGSSFQGVIDDFKVYDRVLAADEARQLGDFSQDLWAVRDRDSWLPALRTLHVDGARGNDANNGAATTPLKTIAHALSLVSGEGTRVVVLPGRYAESNLVLKANGSRLRPIVIEAQTPGKTVITGGEVLSGGWVQQADGSWRRPWPYRFGLGTRAGQPELINRREMVTLDGRVLRQVLATTPLESETFSVDEVAGTLQLKSASDPRVARVEAANALKNLDITGNYIVLRGLDFEMTNPYYGGAAVDFRGSKHLLVEDCNFRLSNGIPLSVAKSEDTLVRRVRGSDGGTAGIAAGFGNRWVLVEDSDFDRNGWRARWGAYAGADPSSIGKNMFVESVTYRRINVVDPYIMAIWLDNTNWYVRIEDSYIRARTDQWNASTLWNEINPQGIELRNSSFLNGRIVLASSEGSTIENCLFRGSEMWGAWEAAEYRGSGYVGGPSLHTHDHQIFGNILINPTSGGSLVGWPAWPDVLGTLQSGANRYWTPGATNPFKVGAKRLTWAQWQQALPQDRTSVFLTRDPIQGGAQLSFSQQGVSAPKSSVPLVLPVSLSRPVDGNVEVQVRLVSETANASEVVLRTPKLLFQPLQRLRPVILEIPRTASSAVGSTFIVELLAPTGATFGVVARQRVVIR